MMPSSSITLYKELMTEVYDNCAHSRQRGVGYPSIRSCTADQAKNVRDIRRIIGMRLEGLLLGRDGE